MRIVLVSASFFYQVNLASGITLSNDIGHHQCATDNLALLANNISMQRCMTKCHCEVLKSLCVKRLVL